MEQPEAASTVLANKWKARHHYKNRGAVEPMQKVNSVQVTLNNCRLVP